MDSENTEIREHFANDELEDMEIPETSTDTGETKGAADTANDSGERDASVVDDSPATDGESSSGEASTTGHIDQDFVVQQIQACRHMLDAITEVIINLEDHVRRMNN